MEEHLRYVQRINSHIEEHKGKVKKVLQNGRRVLIARSHCLCDIYNNIPNLKEGDFVLHNDFETIRKIG